MDYYSVPRRLLRGARQLIYPRRCPFCDQVLGSVPTCPDCAAELEELRRKPGMRLDASQHYLGRLAGAAAPFRYEGGGAFCTPNIMPHRGQQWKWASGWQSWPLAVRCECRVQSCCRNWWRACPLDMTASFLCRHPAQPAATMCRSSWLCR